MQISVPKNIIIGLINLYSRENDLEQLDQLDRLLTHFNIASLNHPDIIKRIQELFLVSPQIYIAINDPKQLDYYKPVILIYEKYCKAPPYENFTNYKDLVKGKKMEIYKIKNYKQYWGHKLLWYLQKTFDGKKFPDFIEYIEGSLYFNAVTKITYWLLTETVFNDLIRGEVRFANRDLYDLVIQKTSGYPTYNFAHIVDDAEMGVTHVMRGVEYLSSTPNYLALYDALGIKRPKLVSLPHILAPQGNKKLGKRDGAKSVTEYRDDGVLPEAMLNYLACLGWNDGTEQEIYTKDELIKAFSLDRIQTSGARYDETKLLWVNGQWLRRIMDEQGVDTLFERTIGFWPEVADNHTDDYKKQVLSIIYDRLKTLSDLRVMTTYFFADPEIDSDMIIKNKFLKKLSESELETLLKTSITKLSALSQWDADSLQDALNQLLQDTGKKPAELFSLIRLSLSFAPFSPALNLTLAVLGRDTSLARLNAAARAI